MVCCRLTVRQNIQVGDIACTMAVKPFLTMIG